MKRWQKDQLSGILYILFSATGFGAMAILIKIGYEAGANSLTMLSLRFGIALALFIPVVVLRKTSIRIGWRKIIPLLIMGAAGYVSISSAAYYSLEFIDAATQALIFYTYPAIVTILATIILKDRITLLRTVALLSSLSGCALIAGSSAGTIDVRGIGLALLAACLYGIYIVLGSRYTAGISPMVSSLYIMCGAMVVFVVITTLTGAWTLGMQINAVLAAAGIALFSTVLAILTFFAGLARLGPAKTAIISTVEPIVTMLLAALILHDQINERQLIGGALIVLGVILLNTGKEQARAQTNA